MSPYAGVVLRKSHLKSKQGCQTCKRRRVKCDETQPTCQRCDKGHITCTYASQQRSSASPEDESISWPAVITQSCEKWKRTGEPPFTFLSLAKSPSWHNKSIKDLRYLYQIGLIESILRLSNTSDMLPPWSDVPKMFQLANSFDFVTYSLAAGSALRLRRISKSCEAAADVARYHQLAIDGISKALQSLTKENADAILGAALSCSYTMSDYRSLKAVAECSTTVLDKMKSWEKESSFYHPISPGPDPAKASPYRHPQHAQCDSYAPNINTSDLLMQGVESLGTLAACFQRNLKYAGLVRELQDVLRIAHKKLNTHITSSEQYRLILSITGWFGKDTETCYFALSKKEPQTLTVLGYLHAVVLALTVALPATNLPIFTAFRVKAIMEVCKALDEKQEFMCAGCNSIHYSDQLTPFFRRVVEKRAALESTYSDKYL